MKKVALVGRTNVGKSTLFNRLSSGTKSLTMNLEGVTRDFISDSVSWAGSTFELVDTAGVSFKKSMDKLGEAARQKAIEIIDQSELVLFIVDGAVGLVAEDRDLAKFLHKSGKLVTLVVNKADVKATEEKLYEFERLGFKEPILISAQHGTGINEVLNLITETIGKADAPQHEEVKFKVVLLGKPNVGKSSLMNLLLQKDRAIVSDIPGTTREPIKENIKFSKENIQFADTAGIRRKKSVQEGIETLMVKSTLDAVRNSDIVLLLVDSSEGVLSDQELKLAFYVFEEGKALIILYNKQDLTTEETKESLQYDSDEYKFFLKKIESLNISCKTGKNVGKILPLVEIVWKRFSLKLDDLDLDELFKRALEERQLYRKTMPLIVRSVEQIKTAPITILMVVNESAWFGPSQLGFFENLLRNKYDLKSVPIKIITRKRA